MYALPTHTHIHEFMYKWTYISEYLIENSYAFTNYTCAHWQARASLLSHQSDFIHKITYYYLNDYIKETRIYKRRIFNILIKY